MRTDTFRSLPVTQENKEGAWLWLFKSLSGALIFIILGVHYVVNHLIGQNGLLTYQEVVNYYKNSIIPIMELIFLALVVPHSLIGLRSILLDLRPERKTLRVIDWILIIVGVVAIWWGAYLLLMIASK
jgi:succinate dehydrogenase / fumarate reductase, membrane anchor subunit